LLSPSLAALTLGCDSGDLGSLSRVQLLLLDRIGPVTLHSPVEDYLPDQTRPVDDMLTPSETVTLIAGRVSRRLCGSASRLGAGLQCEVSEGGGRLLLASNGSPRIPSPFFSSRRLTAFSSPRGTMFAPGTLLQTGPRGPLTAGHLPEHCDSAWKVPGDDKLDWSAGASRCPSPGAMRRSLSQDGPPSSDMDHGSDSGGEAPGWKNPGENFPEKKDWRSEERKNKVLKMLYKLQDHSARRPKLCSDFDDFDFLAKFCIFSPEKLEDYKEAFQAEDTDQDGYISCIQVVDALKSIVPAELLSDQEEIYVYRILALVDFRVTDGLVDLRLFAVIASLAQKIAAMDDFMRSLVTNMDLRSLEVRLFKVKQLFLFLLEERRGEVGSLRGVISAEQFLLELKAGGIHLEEEEVALRQKLQNLPPLDLLDFLAYLPLFMLIHKSVVANPLDHSGPV
ncbi:uncharacterized protein LOC133544043, partial [Nerophis ophidion]|uniref:uncharacterized protein LOC133544043 n=1 Tax=Nerophis ophidion TaxID=159077 RepID=UPI002ADF7329